MDDVFFSGAEARLVKPLPTLIPRCGRCGLFANCNTPKMRVAGDGRRRILIVGEYPTRDDDRAGELGWGELESELDSVGVDMVRDCWVTTATICHSRDIDTHKTAIADCRPNLLRAISECNPEIIITLGAAPIESLIGHVWKSDVGELKRWVGHRIPNHNPNAWICPTYNPTELNPKNPVERLHFRGHLRMAIAMLGRPWPDGPPDYERDVEIVMDATDAAGRIERFGAAGNPIAFDYETNMLKPDGAESEIVCCSISDGDSTIAFPWYGRARRAMMDLLESDVPKIGANIKFEVRHTLAKIGVRIRGWLWDTVLAAHVLDPRGGITSVKFQSFVRLGCPEYNAHIEPYLESRERGGNAVNRIREIKPELLLRYCGVDALLEFHVAQHQMREMGI